MVFIGNIILICLTVLIVKSATIRKNATLTTNPSSHIDNPKLLRIPMTRVHVKYPTQRYLTKNRRRYYNGTHSPENGMVTKNTDEKAKSLSSGIFVEGLNSQWFYYFGAITIGTPPRTFYMDFDTGSADMWVFSSQCRASYCRAHNLYNNKLSRTYTPQGDSFELTYGKGNVNGFFSIDQVRIAGATITQQFAEVTSGSSVVEDKYDGLMGMGFISGAKDDEYPVVYQLYRLKQITAPQFSFYLTAADKQTANGGELILGGVDKSKFTGSIIWTPVTIEYYWQFSLTNVKLGNRFLSGSEGSQAIADTGTSFIYGYTGFVNAIHKAIGAKYSSVVGAYVVPCSKVSALPNLTFTVSGRPLTLLASQYTFKYTSSKKVTYCASSLVGADSSQDEYGNILWILGDVFLRRWYSVYDLETSAVGFAKSISYNT